MQPNRFFHYQSRVPCSINVAAVMTRATLAFFLFLLDVRYAASDSPSIDETPFWAVSVLWEPQLPTVVCSSNDTLPLGTATRDNHFTACVDTLATFDTCDDSCLTAFTTAVKKAPACSIDGTPGTAQEVEAYRLMRCSSARLDSTNKYIPSDSPGASMCSATQEHAWNQAYGLAPAYNSCLKALTGRPVRSCTDECRFLFRDAVDSADECLFSTQAGSYTHHEWLKYSLVWCLTVRGSSLRGEPLLYLKGTSSPSPNTKTPRPRPTPSPSPSSHSSSSSPSSASSSGTSSSQSSDLSASASSSSSGSSDSNEESDASGPPIDIASSSDVSAFPAVLPPLPVSTRFASTASTVINSLPSTQTMVCVAAGLVAVVL